MLPELPDDVVGRLKEGQPEEALLLQRRRVRQAPDLIRHWLQLTQLQNLLGQHEQALATAQRTVTQWPDEPQPRLLLGLCLLQQSRYPEAIESLQPLRSLDAEFATPAAILAARACLELGRPLAAREALAQVTAPHRLSPDWVNEFALALISLQDFDRAQSVLLEGLAQAPTDPFLRTNLAVVFERANKVEVALALLDGLPQLDVPGALLHARLQARLGNEIAALEELNRLQQRIGKTDAANPALVEVSFERARCLQQLARHEEAFQAYVRGNRLLRQRDERRRSAVGAAGRAAVETLLTDFVELDHAVAKPAATTATATADAPIFMVGFPRSGTTLLDRMLARHPALVVVEEQPLLDPVVAELQAMPAGYPHALSSLDEAQKQSLRERFWSAVQDHATLAPGQVLVDKNPFNLLRVHLILTLFPRARWLFVIRHPCDVLLSCFEQPLQYTPLTHGFTDLGEIATLYDRAIGLWLRQKQRLGLHCVELRYEDLVADPVGQMKRVLDALGLEWSEAVLDHRTAAGQGWVTTPSYEQVARPIHRQSVGRWRRYQSRLRPLSALLAPYLRAFGYSDFPDAAAKP